MKKLFNCLLLCVMLTSVRAQVNPLIDSAKRYNNLNIVTNSTQQITAVKVNTAFNKLIAAVRSIDSLGIGDSLRLSGSNLQLRRGKFGQWVTQVILPSGGALDTTKIPLSGTVVGKEITGDLNIQSDYFRLKSERNNYRNTLDFGNYIGNGNLYLLHQNISGGKSTQLNLGDSIIALGYTYPTPGGGPTLGTSITLDKDLIKVNGSLGRFKGLQGMANYIPYYNDSSFIQKKYVDSLVAASSGTTTGTPNTIRYFNADGIDNSDVGLVYSGGNVGIGTSTPITALDVVGDVNISNSTSSVFSLNSASYIVGFGDLGGVSNNVNYTLTQENGHQFFGNVGLGTSTPIESLDVVGNAKVSGTVQTGGYTVATLPTGTLGMMAYVTDATAPTYLGALTGGGSVICPVFFNGTIWVAH